MGIEPDEYKTEWKSGRNEFALTLGKTDDGRWRIMATQTKNMRLTSYTAFADAPTLREHLLAMVDFLDGVIGDDTQDPLA